MATRLGLEESTPLVYLERLRLAGPDPLALDKVWLPERIADIAAHDGYRLHHTEVGPHDRAST